MPTQSLHDAYRRLQQVNNEYSRNRSRWEFLLNSYLGGEEYRRGGYLTRYQLETESEYNARLLATPLDNHCQSVISTYTAFLFRLPPERDLAEWTTLPQVQQFLEDSDHEGRSLDQFMKQVAIWSGVFGGVWVMVNKPDIGAVTQADELAMGVRPSVSMLTPLVVSDWRWEPQPNGSYRLTYLRYVEEVIGRLSVVKEWTPETIKTWVLDEQDKIAEMTQEMPNTLGEIPAFFVYNHRGLVRGVGVSDITDVADIQRQIYNLHSENESAIRLDGHPSLVVPPTAQLGSGAGGLIVLQEGSDAGLNPYYLESGGVSVGNIHASIEKLVEAIDRITFTGGVRGTETKTMSGVALEVEMSLLNAKLAEKADNLELCEEQIWQWFAVYQALEWTGTVKYPDSFNIRDTQREFQQLSTARSTAQSTATNLLIDLRLRQLLRDPLIETEQSEFMPHWMYQGDESRWVETWEQHWLLAQQGWTHGE